MAMRLNVNTDNAGKYIKCDLKSTVIIKYTSKLHFVIVLSLQCIYKEILFNSKIGTPVGAEVFHQQ